LSRRKRSTAGDDIHLRPPLPADHLEIAAIIAALIPRHLGHGLGDEGIAILREHTKEGIIGAKLAGIGHVVWSPALVAVSGARIVGFGAVRDDTHITQLHVIEDRHGRGIGHRIARALIAEIVRRHPRAREVTLSAAEGALVAYLRMGFRPIGPRFNWHGIVAQPMALPLPRFGSDN
jgi:predicted GNAT family N-acyltransferase